MEVYNKYHPYGLEILAFPCNQVSSSVAAVRTAGLPRTLLA
jgi:glutathione peroxidase-family protein